MSFSGDLYPTAGAEAVMNVTGDLVRYNSGARERLGIGSTNQALSVVGGLPAWKTLELAESTLTTEGDILYENSTPALARLPKGSDADVLTLASGIPSWSAPAGGGSLELITVDTTDTGSIWTSPTISANMKTTYSELIVIANLYWVSPYTQFGDTYINLNGITSGYNASNGYYYDGTTMTQLTKASSTVGFISDPAMGLSSGEGMHTETTLAQIDGTTNIISYHSISRSSTGISMVLDTFLDIGSTDIITSIKFQASLAGWASGSNFSVYGRKLT